VISRLVVRVPFTQSDSGRQGLGRGRQAHMEYRDEAVFVVLTAMAESQLLTEAQIAELTFEYRINLNPEVERIYARALGVDLDGGEE